LPERIVKLSNAQQSREPVRETHMATENPSRKLKIGAIIVLLIAAGFLCMVAFEEWLHADSSYLQHGVVAALFLGVVLLYARRLSRLA
jgi:hypothetical protein